MKYLAFTLTLFLTFATSALAQSNQTPRADFQAEIVKTDQREADIKIITVNPNDFQLAPQDFIHVTFSSSSNPQSLEAEDIISGTVFYFQAQVNEQTIDSYLVTDYKLDHRPLLKAKVIKIISYSSALVLVIILIVLEKLRQSKQKKSKQASIV